MTEQRSGEDRRIDPRVLATQKQETLTGGNTNYYLTDLGYAVVEAEDVIELLDMSFALGTVFKSTDRLCKLRLGLGKPGSTVGYEVGKVVYYNDRTAVVSARRENRIGWFGKVVRAVRDLFFTNYFADVNDIILEVTDPKRLEPYTFMIGDYIDALKPSDGERAIFEHVFKIALMRQTIGPARRDEVTIAQEGRILAQRLDELSKSADYLAI